MPNDNANEPGLWEELQAEYDTYEFHSFIADPPDEPFIEHWQAKGERSALIWLGMPVLPILLFRLRERLLRWNVPVLPYLCDRLSTGFWHVSFGRHVEIGPGLFIAHGQVVIDGKVKLGSACVLSPWVTIGLSGRRRNIFDARGPVIGDRVFIGTGAKVLGPITIGDDVRIGANSVVIDDVPSGATVVGTPARIVHETPPPTGAEWRGS
ncbi:MAG: serine acetyltransferase [Chloroflexi bacterium]|nr:serine acetyltransferase [Chloroflexota bacterium]